MPMLTALSPLSIAACVVVSMAVGFLWYSPMLFANRWMRLIKLETKSKEEMQKAMPRCLAISVLSTLLMSVGFAVLLHLIPTIITSAGALKLAVLLWAAFIGTTFATNYAYAGKPLELFLIDAGYPLACLLLQALILMNIR